MIHGQKSVLKTKPWISLGFYAKRNLCSYWMIRDQIDLRRIGVPFPNLENKYKLVFTTHLVEIYGKIEAHKQFKDDCLSRQDAWELFKSKVR